MNAGLPIVIERTRESRVSRDGASVNLECRGRLS